MKLRALLLPLAVLAIGLGVLLGGRFGNALITTGTVLAGVVCVLVATDL